LKDIVVLVVVTDGIRKTVIHQQVQAQGHLLDVACLQNFLGVDRVGHLAKIVVDQDRGLLQGDPRVGVQGAMPHVKDILLGIGLVLVDDRQEAEAIDRPDLQGA